jgi:hypothetical protein
MRAEVPRWRGDRSATQDWVRQHFEVPMEPAEEVLRIATLRALVMTEIDAGDVEAAMFRHGSDPINRGRTREDREFPSTIQMGSQGFFIAAAEAELTRAGTPDPEAWKKAENLASWRYWTLYCRARRLEASHILDKDVATEIASLRADAESLEGILRILDSLD